MTRELFAKILSISHQLPRSDNIIQDVNIVDNDEAFADAIETVVQQDILNCINR